MSEELESLLKHKLPSSTLTNILVIHQSCDDKISQLMHSAKTNVKFLDTVSPQVYLQDSHVEI